MGLKGIGLAEKVGILKVGILEVIEIDFNKYASWETIGNMLDNMKIWEATAK